MVMVSRRWVLGATGALAVAGCVMRPPPPEVPPLDYAARRDGPHAIPAIDLSQIPEWLHRQVVPFETEEPPGTIVIRSDQGLLHLVLEDGYALRYGIGVGREGLGWTGEAEIYRTARWPSWTPTPSMIERDPSLERWADGQAGGPRNPLGARALYMRTIPSGVDEGIRIHGTPEWRSIGHRASAGCFRMLQHDVIDLYGRVGRGTRVVVL
ncbi:L,D-transpeptidase [Pararhodobacter sp. SW119]|uniref:L,D-transpeptidase n=1 Tax=Pararhodobacter sp. SW119 TaxID=2780075 RepID=UPI001AE05272|nr:L,D-transpeptidase [Pararhodobacter sp. SW119]